MTCGRVLCQRAYASTCVYAEGYSKYATSMINGSVKNTVKDELSQLEVNLRITVVGADNHYSKTLTVFFGLPF